MGLMKLLSSEEYKLKVMKVLFSSEARKINFTALGVNINGGIFPKIAYDLANENRYVFLSSSFDDGAAALYHPHSNLINVGKDDNSVSWKGYVIHEAVHAWIDRSEMDIFTLNDEAVAYIGQALYLRQFGHIATDGIYGTAAKIAGDISSGKNPGKGDLAILKMRIINNPAYSHLDVETKSYTNG